MSGPENETQAWMVCGGIISRARGAHCLEVNFIKVGSEKTSTNMCNSCTEWDDEAEDWVPVDCGCPCAEQDLNPSEYISGSTCGECGHRISE